jgi:iron(III) transport system permease protein
MLPMAVPGLVLGLGYIFFFNQPANPLNGLYHTITLLTLCTIVHFYTTGPPHGGDGAQGAGRRVRSVSASLKVPFYKTFWRVTLPICTPALVDIARYFFINAMTTISAVVFLYSPETKVASIAILNLDEAGEMGAAAAMAVLIAAANAWPPCCSWASPGGSTAAPRPGRNLTETTRWTATASCSPPAR